jgi:hypothetical protein
MKRKNEIGCSVCGRQGRPKQLPYGSQKGKFWCSSCDMDLVSSVNKKKERQKSKKEIDKYLDK